MSFYDVKGYYGPSRFHMRSTRNELKLAISFIPTNPSNTQYMSTTIIIIIILKNISRKKKVNVLCITFSWEMACIYVWLGFKKISLIHITYNANFHRGFVECNIINGKIKVQNNLLLIAVHSHRKSTIFHAKMDINSLFGKNSLIRSMKGIILQQTDGGYAAAAAVDPCCHNSTSTKFQHNQTRHSLLNSRF